jgi:hypothetical protein
MNRRKKLVDARTLEPSEVARDYLERAPSIARENLDAALAYTHAADAAAGLAYLKYANANGSDRLQRVSDVRAALRMALAMVDDMVAEVSRTEPLRVARQA